jgi:phosphoribosylformylglycinamidine synthase
MKFLAEIDIMPHKELLDPQGKTVEKNLHYIPVTGVIEIRIGKHIQMQLEAENESEANDKIELACKKLLANLIMENYTFQIKAID